MAFSIVFLYSLLTSGFVLGAVGWFGISLLRRFVKSFNWLESIAYGVPLGAVLASLTMLAVGCFAGLTRAGVLGFTAFFCALAILLTPWRLMIIRIEQSLEGAATRFGELIFGNSKNAERAAPLRKFKLTRLVPALVLSAFVIRWAMLWPNALHYEAECLRAGTIQLWGDWAAHLGDVASFAYGNNFPPQHPRVAGHAFAYHYLVSIAAAAAVKLGADPASALTAQSFILSIFCLLAVYAFGRRLTASSTIATLTVVLFFLGGGLGWLMTVAEIDRTHAFWETLRMRPWDFDQQNRQHFLWGNMYFLFIMPQRGFLFGLPLTLLIFTLLLQAVQQQRSRLFAAAGVVAGLLPLAHLSSMLALAFITPVAALFLWSRRWVWFFATWIAIALPQLYAQQGGLAGPVSSTRIRLGWLAAPDPWLWFWLKNLGFFVPLLVFALADRTLLPRDSRRFLWACMGIFVAANIAQFQPWDWSNHIVMVYWFLAVCVFVAAMMRKLWGGTRNVPLRFIIVAMGASMLASGVLLNLQEFFGHGRHCLLSPEEVMLAKAVRDTTRRSAIFVTGLQNNHPISMLTGRKVVLGYPGWIWPQGIETAEREGDVRAIYAMTPRSPALLRKYNVDYVVIGPEETRVLGANRAAFQKAYAVLLRSSNYEIFSVKKPARN